MSCRANWTSTDENYKVAWLRISSVRMQVEDRLARLKDVHFVISCITGTTNNKGPQKEVHPGIAFFIAFNENEHCNESTLFNVSCKVLYKVI